MKIAERLPAIGVTAILVLGVTMIASRMMSPAASSATVEVKVPALSQAASAGKDAFDVNCAQCHGENGGGGGQGPPLVHDIYNPGHHGDASFFAAAKRGVKRHHWNFKDMPPQPQVKDSEITSIIRYVRELQVANGVVYREHRM